MHVVALTGVLDFRSTAAVEHELTRVEATNTPEIVIDLGGLTSIDTFGLKTIINANVRSRDRGGRLTLIHGCTEIQATFETMGLVTRLPFRRCESPSVAEARESLTVPEGWA